MKQNPFTITDLEHIQEMIEEKISNENMMDKMGGSIIQHIGRGFGMNTDDLSKIKSKMNQQAVENSEKHEDLRILQGKVISLKKELVRDAQDQEIIDSLKPQSDHG